MKYFIGFLFGVLTICSCAGSKNKPYVIFEESEENHRQQPVSEVLIVGFGKLPTRYFLDQIAAKLTEAFGAKGVHARYAFLGSDIKEAKAAFNRVTADNQITTIMTFFETGVAHVATITDTYYAPITSTGGFVTQNKQTRYSQGFKMQLFTPAVSSPVWSSTLAVSYDFRSSVLYQFISKKITASLEKNNFFK